MNPMPVSARRLRYRPVAGAQDQATLVSLVPCFDEAGLVRQLLVITQTPRKVCLLSWEPELVYVPMLFPIQLRRPLTSLRPITPEQVWTIASLWYYDAHRLTGGAVTDPESAVDAFESASCSGKFTRPVGMLRFRRDLSRISLVTISTAKNGLQFGSWKSDLLVGRTAVAPNRPRPTLRRGTWQLDPIWKRWAHTARVAAARRADHMNYGWDTILLAIVAAAFGLLTGLCWPWRRLRLALLLIPLIPLAAMARLLFSPITDSDLRMLRFLRTFVNVYTVVSAVCLITRALMTARTLSAKKQEENHGLH